MDGLSITSSVGHGQASPPKNMKGKWIFEVKGTGNIVEVTPKVLDDGSIFFETRETFIRTKYEDGKFKANGRACYSIGLFATGEEVLENAIRGRAGVWRPIIQTK